MSDEQRKDEDTEVEAHARDGHGNRANEEPRDEADNDVEAHVKKGNG
jgi:hypothetical protein